MRSANFLGDGAPVRFKVDADDFLGSNHARALDDVEAYAPEPEHRDVGARPDLRGVDDGADPGGDAAADVADFVEGRVLAHLGDSDFRQHGKVCEGRAAHVVEHRVAVTSESRCAVWHNAFALGSADRGAEIGAARQAGFALPTFWRVERDDVVARLNTNDACADRAHNAGALVAEDGREDAFWIGAPQRVGAAVAHNGHQAAPLGGGEWPENCLLYRRPTACRHRYGKHRSP